MGQSGKTSFHEIKQKEKAKYPINDLLSYVVVEVTSWGPQRLTVLLTHLHRQNSTKTTRGFFSEFRHRIFNLLLFFTHCGEISAHKEIPHPLNTPRTDLESEIGREQPDKIH